MEASGIAATAIVRLYPFCTSRLTGITVTRTISIILTLLCLSSADVKAADRWSSFQNGGRVSQPADRPLQPGEISWDVELRGYGQSSPVVRDEHIYVTTVEGPNKDNYHITAFALKDGSRLWQQSVANPSPQENNTYVSRSAPSPVTDESGVVCFFEGGIVVAFDHEGNQRWKRDLVADYGSVAARHGLSSSLEQDKDSIFVWVERSEDPYVLRLKKADGETMWKAVGAGATSWASPRLIPVEDGIQLVLSAIGSLTGLDVETGRQLWKFEDISGNSTPTPMPLGDGRFLIGATVGRGESGAGRAAESNGVIQIQRRADGQWLVDYAWRAKRATSSFGSPIVHNNTALFVNREGVLYGLNAKDGKERFVRRLKGSSWATPVGCGSQVFFFGRDGKVDSLSEMTASGTLTTWDELPKPLPTPAAEGRRPSFFSGPVLYAAVWCGDSLLLRRGDHLFNVELESVNE